MKMGDIQMGESKYLSGKDLQAGPLTVQIDLLFMANVGTEEKPEMKACLKFVDDVKPVVLNQTRLEAMWGATGTTGASEHTAVSGHKIELYFDPSIRFGGRQTGGIGIRPCTAAVPGAVPGEPGFNDDIPMG